MRTRTRLGLYSLGVASLSAFACAPSTPRPVVPENEPRVSAGTSVPLGDCAFQHRVDGRTERAILMPDQNAVYWMQPLARDLPGAHFEIHGRVPRARYFSLHVYDAKGRLVDVLADDELADTKRPQTAEGGRVPPAPGTPFRLTLRESSAPTDRGKREPNTLYLGHGNVKDGGNVSQVVYRVYVPIDPGEIEARTLLPQLVYVVDDPSRAPYHSRQSVCRALPEPSLPITAMRALGARAKTLSEELSARQTEGVEGFGTRPPSWFLGASATRSLLKAFPESPLLRAISDALPEEKNPGFYLNVHNAYITTYLNPAYGKLAVFRFRPPSSTGDHRDGQPKPTDEVRFWSLCVYQTRAYMYLLDCKRDDEIERDDDGMVTFVFSAPKDRPEDASGKPYRNWLPYGSPAPLILYRMLRPHPGYGPYPKNYKGKDPFDSREIEKHMGKDAYPRGRYCYPADFVQNRCSL